MRVDVNGVGIEYEVTGEGPPVVLLHGFPDSGRLWRHQVPALVEAGFSTIVPDLRGYGASDKPAEVEAYSIPFLAGDVVAVLDAVGVERAHVVGHDWGAALAWAFGSLLPDRVDHLVALSVGHPGAVRVGGPRPAREVVVHAAVPVRGHRRAMAVERRLGEPARMGRPPRRRRRHRRPRGERSRSRPRSTTTGPTFPPRPWCPHPSSCPPVQAPTMGVWSSGDFALTEAQMLGSADHVAGTWRYERIEGPGHWMQLEAPDAVNELLLDFLPG